MEGGQASEEVIRMRRKIQLGEYSISNVRHTTILVMEH